MNQPGRLPLTTPSIARRRPRALALALLLALLSAPLPAALSSAAAVPAPLTPLLSWIGQGEFQGGEYGYAVAGAGDVDGDGYHDLLIGARRYDDTEYREGVAMLFYGWPGGVNPWRSPWTTAAGQQGARYGVAVSSAGDVNGDGYADVLVGANEHTATYSKEGRAYLYLGSPIGLSQDPAWTLDGGQKDAYLGSSVASAGDVNGDGYDDVIIGAPRYTADFTREGAVFILYGSPTGLSDQPDLILTGGQTNAFFGASVASAGDLNGDGYDDVIIGAPQYPVDGTTSGAALVFYGSPAGLSDQPDLILTGGQAYAQFGAAVASAGDVNGDNYHDVIIGAPLYNDVDAGVENVGALFLFLGSPAGLSPTPHQIITGDQAYARFGASVASLGDLGGNGLVDVIVGAPRYSFRQEERGAILIFFGSPSGLSPTPAWRAYGNKAGALFGHAVTSAGDIDGDGLPDLAIGSPDYRSGGIIVGRTDLYLTRFGEFPYRLFIPLVLHSSR